MRFPLLTEFGELILVINWARRPDAWLRNPIPAPPVNEDLRGESQPLTPGLSKSEHPAFSPLRPLFSPESAPILESNFLVFMAEFWRDKVKDLTPPRSYPGSYEDQPTNIWKTASAEIEVLNPQPQAFRQAQAAAQGGEEPPSQDAGGVHGLPELPVGKMGGAA